jgi:hypothetical protein
VAQSDAATLVFIFLGAGLAHAWELLDLGGGGQLDLPATRGRRATGGAGPGPTGTSGTEPGAKP